MVSRLTLEVIDDIRTELCFSFDDRKNRNVIAGRATNCDISIPGDIHFSRQHFMIKIRSNGMWICDLVSKNGIHINGIRYGGLMYADSSESGGRDQCPQILLNDGDEIRAGRTRFQVRIARYQLCQECGTEIPESDAAQEVAIDSALACSTCRERMVETASADGSSERQQCCRCGKYLPDTTDTGHYTGILCPPCQVHVETAPTILLQYLIKHSSEHQPGGSLPQIKGFTMDRELGACGFGAVYLAHQVKDNRPVVLKIMRAIVKTNRREWKRMEQAFMDIRFRRGARIAGFLDRGSKQTKIHIAVKVATGSDIQRILDDLPSQDKEISGMDTATPDSLLESDESLQPSHGNL